MDTLLAPIPSSMITTLGLLVLIMPLFSFFLNLNNTKKYHGEWIASLILFISFITSIYLFIQVWGAEAHHFRFTWFKLAIGSAEYIFTAGLLINDLSVLMLVVVTLVSFLVHVYSIAYMQHDPHFIRYFAYLGLFTFSMLGIVVSDNLLTIFMFWELVGLSSYLLIGFWFTKKSASNAAKKAFIVNRIGDLGFLIGLMILWSQFKTLDLVALQNLMADSKIMNGQWLSTYTLGNIFGQNLMPEFWITVAGFGLFCGAVGKSAQFPLQVWLPDAMEGPTPVSALIHAATMVAAGVFLLARVFPLLDFQVLNLIAFVGAATAFMGAFAAFAQNDIKKVLAFSTISQLGYMVMGIGVGAYEAATFHLLTHAFFKAGLFLAAGAVITAMHGAEFSFKKNDNPVHLDVQDMRLMGGLRRQLPFTFIVFLIAAAALAGIPFFSGFLSKDAILTSSIGYARVLADEGNSIFYLVPVLGFITVMMTAMYMTRQIILVFFGKNRLPGIVDNPAESLKHLR
ncbi:MAG: NADH-quinone oxidoreductase subunit L, partial [Cyclobacteriaceae bacterium]